VGGLRCLEKRGVAGMLEKNVNAREGRRLRAYGCAPG
jgi:hypothetical protein